MLPFDGVEDIGNDYNSWYDSRMGPEFDGKNGDYAAGRDGFEQCLQSAWDAAMKQGETICKSTTEDCCPTVLVRMQCGNSPGKKSCSSILRKHGLSDWNGKQKKIEGCPKK